MLGTDLKTVKGKPMTMVLTWLLEKVKQASISENSSTFFMS